MAKMKTGDRKWRSLKRWLTQIKGEIDRSQFAHSESNVVYRAALRDVRNRMKWIEEGLR